MHGYPHNIPSNNPNAPETDSHWPHLPETSGVPPKSPSPKSALEQVLRENQQTHRIEPRTVDQAIRFLREHRLNQ